MNEIGLVWANFVEASGIYFFRLYLYVRT